MMLAKTQNCPSHHYDFPHKRDKRFPPNSTEHAPLAPPPPPALHTTTDDNLVRYTLGRRLNFMATVAFPSPSAILKSPTLPPITTPSVPAKKALKKNTTASKSQKATKEKVADPAKPKQTKSRNGCKNCKEKRLKCDETKPKCEQCHKKGVDCRGYEQVLKWRPQEDAFKNNAYIPRPRKKPRVPGCPPQCPPSPPASDICTSPLVNGFAPPSPGYDVSKNPTLPLDPHLTQQLSAMDPLPPFKDEPPIEAGHCLTQSFPLKSESYSTSPSLVNDTFDEDTTPQSARTAGTSLWSGSPRTADLSTLNSQQPDHMNFDCSPLDLPFHPTPVPQLPLRSSAEEEDIEEVLRGPDSNFTMPVVSPIQSDSSSSSGGSWLEDFSPMLWRRPEFAVDSQEMLMLRFGTQTCGILSIKDGPTENPWRTMLWPLIHIEPALQYAVNAMTAFHAAKELPWMKPKGLEYHARSTALLRTNINDMRADVALSTALVLAFCDSWDRLICTGMAHITGGKHLLSHLKSLYKSGQMPLEMKSRVAFLVRTWVYMDVIARLTSLDGDDSEDFDIVSDELCQSLNFNHDIDPLMGCANTMFPIIGRVANLVRKVRKTSLNSLRIISDANVLKSKLEKWQAPLVFEEPQDKSTDVEQALRTAEAYRWATLLYLHQAVPEICYTDITEKISHMANEVLTNLANVPETSGAIIIHIFPLLAASCEAVDPETRTFVDERWHAMMTRMGIRNVDRCWEVIENVWDRRDSAEKEKLRRRARAAASKIQTGYMPASIMQRKRVVDTPSDEDVHDDDQWGGKRRAVEGGAAKSPKAVALKKEERVVRGLEYDLTVRGRNHWAGVMKDWNWEVLLG